jgi:16S rRNA (adenine1518-N6/adenine1519-N6)-dimethyltransferase
LKFDLAKVPRNYKIVANIPYNITAKIVQKILLAKNLPKVAVLLVQKEVAEKLAAGAGEASELTIFAQLYAEISLGIIVGSEKFAPPPKVDSRVVIIRPRTQKLFANLDEKIFFRVVRAGFSARRKKLRSSLAGGLNIAKTEAEELLKAAQISPDLRAQDLTLENWYNLSKIYEKVFPRE